MGGQAASLGIESETTGNEGPGIHEQFNEQLFFLNQQTSKRNKKKTRANKQTVTACSFSAI